MRFGRVLQNVRQTVRRGVGPVAMTLLIFSCLCGLSAARLEAAAEVSHDAEVHEDHGDGSHDDHGAEHGHGDGHGEGGHGDTNPVTLDPDLAIVTGIIFLLLLGVLGKFAWGPIVEALDSREKTVAEQIAAAEANQKRSEQLLAEHETKLSAAAAEVKQLLDQARKDADQQKQEIIDSAQAAAAAEKDRALREIGAAKNTALQELAQKSVDTAVGLAGQIVKRQLNADDHSQLIGDALDQFSSDN